LKNENTPQIKLPDVIDAWNSQADELNQWDMLSSDEMVEFALKLSAETTERLSAWIRGYCFCPCCGQIEKCLESCTFAMDAPDDAERMRNVREVLFMSEDS